MSFSRYNPEDSVISSETVVRGLWIGDANTLTAANMFTASSNTEYYLNTYNSCSICSGSSVQYSIQYGNLNGSGSALINTSVPGITPSRIIYGEYRNLVFGTETQNFNFNASETGSQLFIINVARSRYKESLLPGSFGLRLTSGSSTLSLIDDSSTTSLTRFIGENRVYNIISGSANSAYTGTGAYTNYGIMLPDLNIIVLNATPSTSGSILPFLTGSANINQVTSSAVYNQNKLYDSIVAGNSFKLQSQETVSSRYFFTRVKNGDFNYTTNPSIIDDNGNLLYTTLINNPQTYVTTVGMYNDNNELLAVAKLSRPLTKDFTKEALIRIKLDY